jgi:hypothetical protein
LISYHKEKAASTETLTNHAFYVYAFLFFEDSEGCNKPVKRSMYGCRCVRHWCCRERAQVLLSPWGLASRTRNSLRLFASTSQEQLAQWVSTNGGYASPNLRIATLKGSMGAGLKAAGVSWPCCYERRTNIRNITLQMLRNACSSLNVLINAQPCKAAEPLVLLPRHCQLTYDQSTDPGLLHLINKVPDELWGAKLALQVRTAVYPSHSYTRALTLRCSRA